MAFLVNVADYDYVFYVTKSGLDTNSGLSSSLPKLTILAATNLIKTTTYNNKKVLIAIGAGTYSETITNWASGYTADVTIYGDFDGAITGQAAGDIIITNNSTSATLNFSNMTRLYNVQLKNSSTSSSSAVIGDYTTRTLTNNDFIADSCTIDGYNTCALTKNFVSLTFNNCTIKNTITSSAMCLTRVDTSNSGATYIFNNCYLLAPEISMTTSASSTSFSIGEKKNYCKFFFNGCTLESTYSTSGKLIRNAYNSVYYENCTIKFEPAGPTSGAMFSSFGYLDDSYFKGGYIKNKSANANVSLAQLHNVIPVDNVLYSYTVDEAYKLQRDSIAYENVNDTLTATFLGTGMVVKPSDKTYNGKPVRYAYNNYQTTGTTDLFYRFDADEGVPVTIEVPLSGTANGTVYCYVYKTRSFVKNPMVTAQTNVTANQEVACTCNLSFTPDETTQYYLRVSRTNQTNNVIEIGDIIVS